MELKPRAKHKSEYSNKYFILPVLIMLLCFSTTTIAQDGIFNKFEDNILSLKTTIPLTLGWGWTTYEVLKDPNNFYGTTESRGINVNLWADHLHYGYGLHLLGTYLHTYQSSFYHKLPNGLRLLFCLGSVIQLDDMYQHLYLQKNDGFNLNNGSNKGSQIAGSPLHRFFYSWMLREDHNENWKVMLDLIHVLGITFSAGYYQGPALEVSYHLLTLGRSGPSIKFDNTFGFMRDLQTELALEQVVAGLSLVYRMNDWVTLNVGAGQRLYNNNPEYLETGAVFYYGLKIG